MEGLVHDLPLPVGFEEREQIGVAVAVPVVEFQPHRGNACDVVWYSCGEHLISAVPPV